MDILIHNSLVLLTTNMKCLKLVLLCEEKTMFGVARYIFSIDHESEKVSQ